jgi:hypothetical protein
MAGEMLMKQATPVQPSGPGGFAILCFIVGAPHIYGVIQSHHLHPQGGHPKPASNGCGSGNLFPGILAIAGLIAGGYWLISFS